MNWMSRFLRSSCYVYFNRENFVDLHIINLYQQWILLLDLLCSSEFFENLHFPDLWCTTSIDLPALMPRGRLDSANEATSNVFSSLFGQTAWLASGGGRKKIPHRARREPADWWLQILQKELPPRKTERATQMLRRATRTLPKLYGVPRVISPRGWFYYLGFVWGRISQFPPTTESGHVFIGNYWYILTKAFSEFLSVNTNSKKGLENKRKLSRRPLKSFTKYMSRVFIHLLSS